MKIEELKNLVNRGESDQLEFKRKASHPEKIIREIVAFANTKGGKLLIGVDDDGKLPGLKFADEEQFVVDQAIREFITPKLNYHLTIIPLNRKKSIISYDIFESETKPHYVVETSYQSNPRAYVRVADKTMRASKEVRQIMKKENKGEGIQFRYGMKETKLMKYLDQNSFISLDDFQKIASLPRWLASKTLVKLVLANVLQVKVTEEGDIYLLK